MTDKNDNNPIPPRSAARMAGAYGNSWCPHCRATAGTDCADTGHDSKHWRRVEDRATRRYTDTAMQEEDAAIDADNDPSDCRHGCNGECVASDHGSDRCDFTCHPHLMACPCCGRVIQRQEFHDHENRDCGFMWSCRRCGFMDAGVFVGCVGG